MTNRSQPILIAGAGIGGLSLATGLAAKGISTLVLERTSELGEIGHLCPAARRIIGQGRTWKNWVLCDRDPILQWSRGRVTLLGDAAHPTLQYMAQGACMAMEDAVCLADEVATGGDEFAGAFERYQRRRVDRTTRIQLQSRFNGEHLLHPSGAHAELRNTIMRSMKPEDFHDTLSWLYGDTGLTGTASGFGPQK